MVATFIILLAFIVTMFIVLQKWSKDSKREDDEADKFNQYEDDWIKIHRD